MSVQEVDAASQKFTWPCDTVVPPAFTAAVSVSSEPRTTDPPDGMVTPADWIVSEVAVETGAAKTTCPPPKAAIATSAEAKNKRGFLILKTISNFGGISQPAATRHGLGECGICANPVSS